MCSPLLSQCCCLIVVICLIRVDLVHLSDLRMTDKQIEFVSLCNYRDGTNTENLGRNNKVHPTLHVSKRCGGSKENGKWVLINLGEGML